jgi:AraC family transcriptional regulator of adaptative response/methylated-DNA-[protein]-cysteine methyltransferase
VGHEPEPIPLLATTEARRWQAVATRDATSDGAFVYAVASTGVFCRPSCPSRRPQRHNVRFFDSAEAAVAAGFRACRRCRPEVPGLADPERRIVEAVCGAIAEAEEAIPTLDELAEAAGVSPHHLQRVFTRANTGCRRAVMPRPGGASASPPACARACR